MSSVSHVYGFDVFELDEQAQMLLASGEIIDLTNAEFSLLLYFVKNPQTKHAYGDLYEEVFGLEGRSLENTVPAHISNLRKKLRAFSDKKLIKNIARFGYRFDAEISIKVKHPSSPVVDVAVGKNEADPEVEEKLTNREKENFVGSGLGDELSSKGGFFSEHLYFVVASCLLYSSVCVVSLFLETAYRFQEYKSVLFRVSVPVFLLAALFSFFYFRAIYFTVLKKDSNKVLVTGILSALTGGFLIVLIGSAVLPAYPVTRVVDFQMQPQTAQSSYFKNIFIYLHLFYLPGVIIPYGLIISWKKKIIEGKGEEIKKILAGKASKIVLPSRLNFSPLLMLIILFLSVIFSIVTTHNFLDKLEPGENQDLFSKLMWLRNLLYYSIGILGVWWYYEQRMEIEAACESLKE